jgi:hypothetical protein
MKKLTLSLGEETIALAHKLARERRDSISHMVEEYFRSLKKPETTYVPEHPRVRKLYGIFKGASLPSDKKALRELHAQKYLQ